MTQKPPSYSFVSVNGPSVVTTSPSVPVPDDGLSTVAVVGGCSPPPNTHALAALICSFRASTSA